MRISKADQVGLIDHDHGTDASGYARLKVVP